MVLSPSLVVFYWISLSSFHGSINMAWQLMLEMGPINFFRTYAPRPSVEASIGYGAWLLFQAALYLFLPSVISTGQLTPAGNLLKYRTNGLLAWFVTHGLFFGLSMSGHLDPAILAKNWEGLLVAANIWGFLLASIAYIKAHVSPSHELDRKFSGMDTLNQVEIDD
jgi:7-dehydrocholesterol reductase